MLPFSAVARALIRERGGGGRGGAFILLSKSVVFKFILKEISAVALRSCINLELYPTLRDHWQKRQ